MTCFIIISIYTIDINIGRVPEKDEKLFLLMLALRCLCINMPMAMNDISTIKLQIIELIMIGVNNLCASSLLKSDVVLELTATRK